MNEADCIRRAQQGDAAAIRDLYRRYAPRVHAVVRRLAPEVRRLTTHALTTVAPPRSGELVLRWEEDTGRIAEERVVLAAA